MKIAKIARPNANISARQDKTTQRDARSIIAKHCLQVTLALTCLATANARVRNCPRTFRIL